MKICSVIICLLTLVAKGVMVEPPNSRIVKIAVMGTNDLHGSAFPKELQRRDTSEEYRYGGLAYLARLIRIIRKEYGNASIYLDSGDQYQGSVEAGPEVSKGRIISDFLNEVDLKASALGNHEFDIGEEFLLDYLNSRNAPSLAANLFSEDGDPNFLPNQHSSQIYDLAGVKLGVIGLSTVETPTTTSGFSMKRFPKYQFHEYPAITISEAAKLRAAGADIVIVLAHFGNKCTANRTYDVRTSETKQDSCESDEVITFIDRLPEGTIDGILCGHRHQFVHHWYKNVPFMGSIDGGYYFNVMYFYFDLKRRKILKT
jgi:5'-nucleotidase